MKKKLVVVSYAACASILGDYMSASILDLEGRPDSGDSNGNPLRRVPLIQIAGIDDMDQEWGYCVLDSILYMSGEKKSVYKVDLSKLSTCTSETGNYRAEKMHAEMLSEKKSPVATAISMPDGSERVLVFSTRDLCADPSIRKTTDFEIYDPNSGIWVGLPGSDIWGDDAAVWFDIVAFTVPKNKSLLLIQTYSDDSSIYALDFLSPHVGWQKRETYLGVKSIPFDNSPHSLFVDDEICLTGYGAYDILEKAPGTGLSHVMLYRRMGTYGKNPSRFFSFPQQQLLEHSPEWCFYKSISPLVTLLGYDSNSGDCEFCVVHLGLNRFDSSAWIQQFVYKFNLKEYRAEKREKKGAGGEAAKLRIHILKHSSFQAVRAPCIYFDACYLNSF
ncbi:unnamed protein product [Cuscuta epithymum]|uniref:Uncharacterized protein n=1 Tax=Cuscuta epithymum TaxID=186058 RepID=A0AAV0CRW7_9ASTE|nr:unnamed protein product [Cuscuta epithymum]